MSTRAEDSMTAKAERPATLLDAINALEALEGQLTEFLKISRADGGVSAQAEIATETTVLTARNRILQVNRDLGDILENLEKKRAQLQIEFGEKLL